MPILSEIIKELLRNQDWRHQFAAIMALSQVGEFIKDASQLISIIQITLQYLESENPMLRYAACHAAGQISNDR